MLLLPTPPSTAFSPPPPTSARIESSKIIANTQELQQQCRRRIPLFSSGEDDIFDDFGDAAADDAAVGSGAGYGVSERLPFQTDGGVIMPEGGANPCVIKVRR